MSYRLGINTGFAVNRYSEPEEWTYLVGKDLDLRYAQFTADLLNPSLPDTIIQHYLERINHACEEHHITIQSTFTGAFTRVNHLAHPDKKIQRYWIEWFKRYIDISVELGAQSMGSHFGIFTEKDNNDVYLQQERRQENIENWHIVGKYAVQKGLKFLSWEPMSISREQGETINACRLLQQDVNKNAPISFKLCLDVDHGDLSSPDPQDTDPYAWIQNFSSDTAMIHLKQTTQNKGGHWPFIAVHNKEGKITPERLVNTLQESGVESMDLILELSFREREPSDSTVRPVLKESVEYWRKVIRD